MKRIAIFVSGNGESTERIVKLFNEGNRLRTEIVAGDETASDVLQHLSDKDVTCISVSELDWPAKALEIASLLREKEIDLLVIDDFSLVIPDEIMEAVGGEFIRVSSPAQAPREVVAALEAELRKPLEEKPQEPTTPEDPTPESEWADTLKIQFTPPKIPGTPPEPPREDYLNNFNPPQPERRLPEEPMPSTWLIWSILVTIFCCFIPGIIAIIFSSQVSSRYYIGDVEGARRASRMAEIWIIVSFVLGVLAATLYIPFMIIGW